ncbi:MAG: hypothetical protein K2L02_06045 [Clostridia bacterium]|nr:hypothetical protein [Clostridia bacterium]
MKKKRFASLLIVAPLALLAACNTTPSLALEANWLSNKSKIPPDDFIETLEYAVTFEKNASATDFYLNFTDGSYKTTFRSGSTEGQKTYVYETELSVKVQYTLNNASVEFEDSVITRVEFLNTQNDLKPLWSMREVHATAPLTNPSSPPASLDRGIAYGKYDYKTEITYDYVDEKATFTITDLASETTAANAETTTIKLKGKGLYFDNEQLIPVLRAAELSSSMSLRTVDPTTRTLEKITVKNAPAQGTLNQTVKFKDTEKSDFDVIEIGLAYNKQNSGGTQTFTFATDKNNTYRSVLLKYEYPVIYSHGTMTYKLTTANFYN